MNKTRVSYRHCDQTNMFTHQGHLVDKRPQRVSGGSLGHLQCQLIGLGTVIDSAF